MRSNLGEEVKISRLYWFPVLGSVSNSNGHLFCTLISENEGLEKLRSVSNLKKNQVLSPGFFSGLWYKSEKNPVDKLKKIQVY